MDYRLICLSEIKICWTDGTPRNCALQTLHRVEPMTFSSQNIKESKQYKIFHQNQIKNLLVKDENINHEETSNTLLFSVVISSNHDLLLEWPIKSIK